MSVCMCFNSFLIPLLCYYVLLSCILYMYILYIYYIYKKVIQRKSNIFKKYFGYCLFLLILFYNSLLHLQAFMIHNFFEIKQCSW